MKTVREEALAQLIMSRLREDKRTCAQTIDVAVVGSDIYLVGSCDTEEQKIMAVMIAKGVGGVRVVIDQLRVRRAAASV